MKEHRTSCCPISAGGSTCRYVGSLNHLRDSFPVIVVALHSSVFVVFIRVHESSTGQVKVSVLFACVSVSSASAEGNGRSCFVAPPKTQSSNYVQNN